MPGEVSEVFKTPSHGHVAKARLLTSKLFPVPEKPPKIRNGLVLMAAM